MLTERAESDMTTTRLRRLANATWLVALVYLVAQWLVALHVGLLAAAAVVLTLAAGSIAALVCLRQAWKHSAKGILVPAIAGLILNTVAIVVVIPNVVRAAKHSHARAAQTDAISTTFDHASASVESRSCCRNSASTQPAVRA